MTPPTGWQIVKGKLHRELKFRDFEQAFALMTKVAELAEEMNHHPDWSNSYNTVTIDLFSHSAGKVTDGDFELAEKINSILDSNEHLSVEELQRRLKQGRKRVQVGGRYRHYKGGEYRVEDVVLIEATNSVAVVYRPEYAEGLEFTRPLFSWLQTVMVEGKTVPRFTKLTD